MSFAVTFTPEAEDDLTRLFDFLLDRAKTAEDLDAAQAALDAIRATVCGHLAASTYSFRKAGKQSSTRRELIIPLGATGYVALYEIESATRVVVLAVRHQREEDYH